MTESSEEKLKRRQAVRELLAENARLIKTLNYLARVRKGAQPSEDEKNIAEKAYSQLATVIQTFSPKELLPDAEQRLRLIVHTAHDLGLVPFAEDVPPPPPDPPEVAPAAVRLSGISSSSPAQSLAAKRLSPPPGTLPGWQQQVQQVQQPPLSPNVQLQALMNMVSGLREGADPRTRLMAAQPGAQARVGVPELEQLYRILLGQQHQ
mmetsp:Transcript_31010/g.68798  ORF Transcript_31010/g.68798 Transcript_31010/m.68798 type:complete len:207 (+) Transcript_31010:225-845(+)|eukprot:CAMPEP_0202902224 /NCGR_PEP_ID=MMETSP1392-20130828/16733_1 /ASSEMBLY_ACC=CAM_ASM_000868 /TAXON_ID=225041 /ORGANISM="Chlamydomonas chlamydogama, Strain SAG 11-48b" /LENGTH=206 /DNA_ID=CAMNT_0049588959 /DNA_START=222 /DNA_END=842 /DNA_ORIENTATION=-